VEENKKDLAGFENPTGLNPAKSVQIIFLEYPQLNHSQNLTHAFWKGDIF